MEEKFVSLRECEIKTVNVCKHLEALEERVEKLENKFWWIITLLVGNLVGVIILLLKGVLK